MGGWGGVISYGGRSLTVERKVMVCITDLVNVVSIGEMLSANYLCIL